MNRTGNDLVEEARRRVVEIDAANAIAQHARGDVTFLDVREPDEWNLGHIPNAVHIPRGELEPEVEGSIPRDRNIVVYCAGGVRSALAADTLHQMGYEHVTSLKGGIQDWAACGGDIED